MGMKNSKHIDKRYRIRDNFQPVRWNYPDHFPTNDPMNDPTYNLQGEPDESTNDSPRQINDDVWIPRDEENRTAHNACDHIDIYASQYDSNEFLSRETVLQGTVSQYLGQRRATQHETAPKTPEQNDHYDVINESDLDLSDTELKQVSPAYKNNDHLNVYHRFPKHRANYEQMVRIFKPLIVKNVNVKRLLPYLPFLCNVECRIRAIEERDPHAAIIYLIDELCSDNSAEPGRWKQFIQALETCGYKYIVDTLRGEENIDHTYQRQYLKIITPVLRQLIEPHEVLQALWACDVISSEDNEEVIQTERTFGSIAAADKLLDMVPRRHKFWYAHLVDALTNAGRNEAADILAIPEILDSGEEKPQKYKNSEKVVDERESVHRENTSTELNTDDYLEMLETEQYNEEHISERNMYLDCSGENKTCDNDEIDELYLKIRDPDNKPEGILNSLDNSKKSITVETGLRYEEYNPTESGDVYKSLNEGLSEESFLSKPPHPPPRIPKCRMSKEYSKNDINGLQVDLALEVDIHDDTHESNSVEVVRLTTPEPRKRFFPEHIPHHSNKDERNKVKQLNKPPVPTPRTRSSLCETEKAKSDKTQSNDQVMCTDADKSGTTKIRIEDHLVRGKKGEGTDQTDGAIKIPKQTLGDIQENEEIIVEDTDLVSKRFVCSKTKTTIRKRKNKLKFFKKSKINSRRKSLKIASNPALQNHIGAICKNQGKSKRNALINRERMALPKMQNSLKQTTDNDYCRSKSLPTNIVKGFRCQDESYEFGETIGNSEMQSEYESALSYSEPFRCFRGKEDEEIFATVGQFLPGFKPKTNQRNLWNFSSSLQQRGIPETDELLDILESCNNESNVDQISLKSNTEIKAITKDNLNPNLKKSLAKVRELEAKLNHEVHNGKILRRTLQLQGDVNELLKQNRHTLSQLSVKEKEAKALEAAMTQSDELYDVSESAADYECQNKALFSQVDKTSCTAVNKNMLIERDCFTEQEQRVKENNFSHFETVKGDTFDKDSAFCSEFTTKL